MPRSPQLHPRALPLTRRTSAWRALALGAIGAVVVTLSHAVPGAAAGAAPAAAPAPSAAPRDSAPGTSAETAATVPAEAPAAAAPAPGAAPAHSAPGAPAAEAVELAEEVPKGAVEAPAGTAPAGAPPADESYLVPRNLPAATDPLGSRLIDVATPSTIGRRRIEVLFTHRFNQPVNQGGNAHNLWGLDLSLIHI